MNVYTYPYEYRWTFKILPNIHARKLMFCKFQKKENLKLQCVVQMKKTKQTRTSKGFCTAVGISFHFLLPFRNINDTGMTQTKGKDTGI